MTLELQAAIVAAIESDEQIMALIGGIYDHVSNNPYNGKAVYISFGPFTSRPVEYTCWATKIITVQLDVWSNSVGRVAASRVGAHLERILHNGSLNLPHLARQELILTRTIPDPEDGVTHGIHQFEFEMEDHNADHATQAH